MEEKYFKSYKILQKYEQNKRVLLGYLILLLFALIIILIISNVKHYSQQMTNVSFITILFLWVFYFSGLISLNPELHNLKEAIIFLALKANEELCYGNSLTASIAIKKLLHFLKQSTNNERIVFSDEKFPLKKFTIVNMDRINYRSIIKYIQLNENCNEFKKELNNLAQGFIDSNGKPNYLIVQHFLVFLQNNIENIMLPSYLDFVIKITPILSLFSPFKIPY